MSFELRDRDLLGRIGRLKTKSGVVKTPAFMPVVNPITQIIPPQKMKDKFGCDIIITNSYIIKRNFGKILDLTVKDILSFDGVIATDSGAYQILIYGGVKVNQEEIIEFQKHLDSDISVILDIPSGWEVPKKEVMYTVEETIRRAKTALPLIHGDDRLWVGPVQGGRYLDLVAKSAQAIGKMPYQIHALGSPTEVMQRYMFDVLVDMVMTAKLNLPPERPLHLFGAGHPLMLALAVALGCDLFDSAAYAIYARDMRYLTNRGTTRLQDLQYLPCSCPICQGMDVQNLKEMSRGERVLCLSEHNLYVTMREIQVVKQSIVEGSLWDLVENRVRGHPSMTTAFKILSKYRNEIEEGSPGFKGHGVFYHDYNSLARPEITRHIRLLTENYFKPRETDSLLLLKAPKNSPYRMNQQYRELKTNIPDGLHICFYAPPYGVIPEQLSETYPLSQFDIAEPLDHETMEHTARVVAEYVKITRHDTLILYCGKESLDKKVRNKCLNACKESETTLNLITEEEPWKKNSLDRLSEYLNTRFKDVKISKTANSE